MMGVAGLWIDHRKAVIVKFVGDEKKIILTLQSHVEPRVRFAGGAGSKASRQFPQITPEDQRDRRFAEHLNVFYDEVISNLREADAVLLFGPGEAKRELEKRLEGHGLGRLVVGVETIDKMTDRQIAAKVRQHFLA